MNRVITTAVASLVGLVIVGCEANKGSSPSALSAVADVSPTSPAFAPAPQPVIYDTTPIGGNTTSSSSSKSTASFAGNTSGGNYTVKKGDTLYAIARSKYGDGKQWQKIASANPGLTPSSLKVGQSIVIP